MLLDFVTLATGNRCGRAWGHVTVLDMAWQMGRICRWTGGGEHFWSDMLHSFVVADFVEDRLKVYALIHDSPECVGNDVPKPMKTDEHKAGEDAIMNRTLEALRLKPLSEEDKAQIKVADNRARNGEAWVVGNVGNRLSYPDRDLESERVVAYYLKKFPYRQTIERNGRGPKEFIRRYELYRKMWMAHVSTHNIPVDEHASTSGG